VLEVSVGTGANIPHLRSDSEVFGLDISWGMLKRCQKHLARWK
jgi:ubiquinone/menaquinone biosynthesis C-methylase UbiE